MNSYNEGNLLIYHLRNTHGLASLCSMPMQEHSTKPQTPLSTSLSEFVYSTLLQDDFVAHVPATGGKPHVYSFIQVRLDKRLLYI